MQTKPLDFVACKGTDRPAHLRSMVDAFVFYSQVSKRLKQKVLGPICFSEIHLINSLSVGHFIFKDIWSGKSMRSCLVAYVNHLEDIFAKWRNLT